MDAKKMNVLFLWIFFVDEHMDEKMDSPVGRRSNNEVTCNDA
jgi:hypothetical protein